MTATVTRLDDVKQYRPEITTVTPQLATKLLESNSMNRPVSDAHVHRIARQITEGKWKFNGDTIKIADTKDVVDGQHRLWAIIEANRAVETIIVYGVHKDAFSTLDTIRKSRSAADILSLAGMDARGRNSTAGALRWLCSYQKTKGDLKLLRKPQFKIENSDVETAYAAHPEMPAAVERVKKLHDLAAISGLAFVYYVAVSKNEELANQMIDVLDAPAGIAQSHPFFKLRQALISSRRLKHSNTLEQIALLFKGLNAAKEGKRIDRLIWKSQGEKAEDFPKLKI